MELIAKQISKYLNMNVNPGVNTISEITKHVYLSNDNMVSNNKKMIRSLDVVNIIHVGPIKLNNVDNIIVDNDDDFVDCLDDFYDKLHQNIINEKKTLISCDTGMSLSAAFVAFYFLRRYYVTNYKKSNEITKDLISNNFILITIIKFIKYSRPCIHIHHDLILDLVYVEDRIKKYFKSLLLNEAKNNNWCDDDDVNNINDNDSNESDDLDDEDIMLNDNHLIDKYIDNILSPSIINTEKQENKKKKYDELSEMVNYILD